MERLQVNELRNGGKYNRKDELPYNRISSVSLEEKVSRRGSWILTGIGLLLLLGGIGIPGLSLIPVSPVHAAARQLSLLMNVSALQSFTLTTIGFVLLASRYPRKTSDEWWQVRGPDLGQDEYGWQIAGKTAESEKLVETIREGISSTRKSLIDD